MIPRIPETLTIKSVFAILSPCTALASSSTKPLADDTSEDYDFETVLFWEIYEGWRRPVSMVAAATGLAGPAALVRGRLRPVPAAHRPRHSRRQGLGGPKRKRCRSLHGFLPRRARCPHRFPSRANR